MKNIFLYLFVGATFIFSTLSCNQKTKKADEATANDKIENTSSEGSTANFSIQEMVSDYLTLKNALVADNSEAAAKAGKRLLETLNAVDIAIVPDDKKQEYKDITDDAKENAEHIAKNEGNITHQREHLVALSKDINDLIVMFGTSQKLYQIHCPMYNNGKGAIWISETDSIKNPYYGNGNKMFSCGIVKQTF